MVSDIKEDIKRGRRGISNRKEREQRAGRAIGQV